MLGIPSDVIDATEHLLRIADDWRPRAIDLGEVNGRKFVFSAGVGLDASVVERVDAHPGSRPGWASGTTRGPGSTRSRAATCCHPPRLEAIGRRRAHPGRDHDRPERDPVHVLRRPSGRDGAGRHAGERRPGRDRARARPARAGSRRSSGARCPSGRRSAAIATSIRSAASRSSSVRTRRRAPAAAAGRRRLHRRRRRGARSRRARRDPRCLLNGCGSALTSPSRRWRRLVAGRGRSRGRPAAAHRRWSACPARPGARCSRPTTPGTSESTGCPWPATRRR